jgi:hypothetical protein
MEKDSGREWFWCSCCKEVSKDGDYRKEFCRKCYLKCDIKDEWRIVKENK